MTQRSVVRDRVHVPLESPSSPFNVDYPDLVESGDLLELLVVSPASNNNFTASGWTSLAKVDGVSGLTAQKFYRTASGGEAGSTFALSQSSSGDVVCIVRAIREDLNPGTPEAASTNGGSSLFDAPSLTPSGGNRLYLWTVDGGFRFGNRIIDAWDSNLEQRIQQVVTGISCNGVGSERLFTASTYDPPAMSTGSGAWAAFTTAIPIDSPSASTFPTVESTSQGSWTTASATQSLTLPSGVQSGDLLVATIASDQDSTVIITGWSQVATDANPGGFVGGTVLQREADGTEGATVTVNFSPSEGGSYICRRISGADATKTEAATNSSDSSQSPTWPNLTPTGGVDTILWLADAVNDSTRFLVGWPVNFGAQPLVEQDSDLNSDGVSVGLLARNAATVTPGDGLLNIAVPWVTLTVAIYPEATAGFGVPQNVSAVAQSDSEILVSWDAVTDATAYDVERDSTVVAYKIATTSFSDTGLDADTEYSYRVRAARPR